MSQSTLTNPLKYLLLLRYSYKDNARKRPHLYLYTHSVPLKILGSELILSKMTSNNPNFSANQVQIHLDLRERWNQIIIIRLIIILDK